MLVGVGHRKCPKCWACKESVEHVLFECASYDPCQRQNFSEYLKQVLLSDEYEIFLCNSSIFNKAVFCLGKNKVC